MPIDASIIAGLKPIQIQQPPQTDPVERAVRMRTFQNLMQQSDDEDAQRQALISSGGDNERYRALLADRGQHKAVEALDKAALEKRAKESTISKDTATAGKADTEAAMIKLQHGAALLDQVKDQASWDNALRIGSVTGTFPKEAISKFPQQYDPQFVEQMKQAGLTRAQQLTDQRAREGQDITKRGQDMTATTAATQGAANRANRLTVAGLDANGRPLNSAAAGEPIDLAKVAPVDLEAAYRYFADGTLPPNMGRGQQGMAESQRIRSISAQISQSLGVSPEEARANQLLFKGSGQAVTQLVKREAQVGANVRNFDFNADQVLQLSQKVDRTGTPVINGWINAGRRSVQGDPQISAFDVAVKTTVNEFAQIVSGTTAGATTEGEKQKAEKLLSAAQTPEQVTAVINQMRIESQNRMKSFADQKKETLARLRAGGPKPETPIAPPPIAPTAVPDSAGWTVKPRP